MGYAYGFGGYCPNIAHSALEPLLTMQYRYMSCYFTLHYIKLYYITFINYYCQCTYILIKFSILHVVESATSEWHKAVVHDKTPLRQNPSTQLNFGWHLTVLKYFKYTYTQRC